MKLDDNMILDETFALEAGKGDKDAFDALVRKYQKPVINFANRYLNDFAVAEELAQEVFVRCYRNIGSFNPDYKFSTWIFTIACNLCKNEIRDRKKQLNSTGTQENSVYENHDSTTPVKHLLDKEVQREIARAMQFIPEYQRSAIILSFYEGMNYKEIAVILNTTENTVKSWIFRGKQVLAEKLKRYWYDK